MGTNTNNAIKVQRAFEYQLTETWAPLTVGPKRREVMTLKGGEEPSPSLAEGFKQVGAMKYWASGSKTTLE